MQQANRETHIIARKESSFSGPIPHPETLQAYNLVVSGAAERIIAMAESEAAHLHAMEKAVLEAHKSEVKTGQWMAFVLAIIAIGAAVYLSIIGAYWVAGIIGGSTAVAIVASFILGRVHKK